MKDEELLVVKKPLFLLLSCRLAVSYGEFLNFVGPEHYFWLIFAVFT